MIGDQTRIRAKDRTLVDQVLRTPVDTYEATFRRRLVFLPLGILLLLIALLWMHFRADRPVDYADIQEHFKYGSIGSETGGSLLNPVGGILPPYWIFKALPEICPEKLPGGYASLGLLYEPGHDLPVGVSRRQRLGVTQVGLNCGACHTGIVEGRILPGMPSHQLDLRRLIEFVVDCTCDERTTGPSVLGKARLHGGGPGFLESILYRTTLVSQVKMQTLRLRQRIAPLLRDSIPAWGRGRVDTFNPYKAVQFNWLLDQLPHDELIGAADFPSLWNQAPRAGLQLHWDGDNDSVDERNLSAALGAGVTPVTVDHVRIKRVRDWIWNLPPPKYPFEIDDASSARGKAIFEQHCASCHAFGAPLTGKVTPIGEIGTDPHRLNSYTWLFAVNQGSLYPDSQYRFTHFRKTDGYANQPLDGIWARAPYLHNGSVPTLADLLEAPDSRPRQFFRGYDRYDRERAGFVSSGEQAKRFGTLYDTAVPGNANGGHLYGTNLPAQQKKDLVEYMKTL